jgi:hypothetical protein
MCLLHGLNNYIKLSREMQDYIDRYKIIYKSHKKRENCKNYLKAKIKGKAM